MHLQPVLTKNRSFTKGRPRQLFDRGVTLPTGSAMQENDIERVIKLIHTTLVTRR